MPDTKKQKRPIGRPRKFDHPVGRTIQMEESEWITLESLIDGRSWSDRIRALVKLVHEDYEPEDE